MRREVEDLVLAEILELVGGRRVENHQRVSAAKTNTRKMQSSDRAGGVDQVRSKEVKEGEEGVGGERCASWLALVRGGQTKDYARRL